MARDEDTWAFMVAASASSLANPSLEPTPRPPDTRIFASVISTLSLPFTTSSSTFTWNLEASNGTSTLVTTPFRLASGCIRFITPGRTVAICGRCSVQIMVAIRFPPKAGRVICRSPVSPTSSLVQSAVSPVTLRAESRGPRSRPMVVAPISTTLGLNCLIIWVMACA